jgi:hypothetical protein
METTMQPSQLMPRYPFYVVGLNGSTISGAAQACLETWRPQVEPLPYYLSTLMPAVWPNPAGVEVELDLTAYIERTAGGADDLDPAFEAAAVEHLLRSDDIERP